MSGSWLESLQASATAYAGGALQLGEDAGATLALRLSGALARIQTLPGEAAAAVGELTGAIEALLGTDGHVLPCSPPIDSASGAPAGQGGEIEGTARLLPQAAPHIPPQAAPRNVPRRLVVDPAAFARFIRAQHPAKPAEHAAALTGISVDTMEKMLARETLPNGPHFVRCIVAYGPAILAAVMPEADDRWLLGAQILADQERLEAELARTREQMTANLGRWSFCGIRFGVPA